MRKVDDAYAVRPSVLQERTAVCSTVVNSLFDRIQSSDMASNQSQYTGQIQDGQMHGRGKLVYPNAEVYEVMLTLLAVEYPPCAICFLLVNCAVVIILLGRLGVRQKTWPGYLLLLRWR